MSESNEKWFILAILAVAIYFFFRKGAQVAGQAQGAGGSGGSFVNPINELFGVPAQSTVPVSFVPAQPATGANPPARVGLPTPAPRPVGPIYSYPAPPVTAPRVPIAPVYSGGPAVSQRIMSGQFYSGGAAPVTGSTTGTRWYMA